MTSIQHPRDGDSLRKIFLRWGIAVMLVAAVHGGAAFAIVKWPIPEDPASETPAAPPAHGS